MKKLIPFLILALSFVTAFSASANDNKDERTKARQEKWEQFRQEKNAFYVKTMELTEEQASQFIPLFEEMEKKKFEANREVRHEARAIINGNNITDEQYKAAADRAASLHAREAEIEKEYYARFCNILTPRQQFLYHRCEAEFQKQMIHKRNKKDKQRESCK